MNARELSDWLKQRIIVKNLCKYAGISYNTFTAAVRDENELSEDQQQRLRKALIELSNELQQKSLEL